MASPPPAPSQLQETPILPCAWMPAITSWDQMSLGTAGSAEALACLWLPGNPALCYRSTPFQSSGAAMNRRNLVIGLLGLAALVAGCAPSDIIACDPEGCISENKLSTNIANALDNNVVGYVAHVGGLPPIFSGQARTSTDPPSLAMLPTEFTDVASVSKTLTAIGVLQSLAKHRLTINSNI